MSDLAFTQNGDSFEVPATVTGWRIRRLKPRGAPELVYGRDGRPLVMPVECEMDELRGAVGTLGKYRLDPVDDNGKVIEGIPAAYVQVVKPDKPAEEATTAPLAERDSVIREAMRMNTELAKTVVDRFPEMMHAAAELLRAADGAGLPARVSRAIDEDDDEDGDDDAEPSPRPGFDLTAFLMQIAPMIGAALGSGKAKVPALGEMLDWRKAAAKAGGKPAKASKPAEEIETRQASTVPENANDVLPPIDPSTMAHFVAVQSALTPEESAIAREVAKELGAADLRAWFDELSALSVPEAVEKVRKLISGYGKDGGAS